MRGTHCVVPVWQSWISLGGNADRQGAGRWNGGRGYGRPAWNGGVLAIFQAETDKGAMPGPDGPGFCDSGQARFVRLSCGPYSTPKARVPLGSQCRQCFVSDREIPHSAPASRNEIP